MTPGALRLSTAPAFGLLAVAIIALAAGYFTKSSPEAVQPRLSAPEVQKATVRGEVLQISSDRITVSTREGTRIVRIGPATIFETLGTTTPLHVEVGADWLNVGAIPHPQTLFVINGLVVISEAGPP